MAEGARLESVYTATYREFESLTHRHILSPSRNAGAFSYLKPSEQPEGSIAHLSSYSSAKRECTYLLRGRRGIDSFRWNVSDNRIYQQTKLGLRTRNFLKAVNLASSLALKITSVGNPMPEELFVFHIL